MMKQTLRNSIIRFLQLTGVAALYRSFSRRKGPLVRIVVFHDIPSAEWFKSMIHTLVTHYHVLTPEAFRKGDFKGGVINVLVTFDDGYESWVSYAAPILNAYNVKGIFFMNSGLLESAKSSESAERFMREQLMIRPRAPLTWEGARALITEGHTIGSHAEHHVNLAALPYDQALNELQADRKSLESHLGITVTECAYPFGTLRHVNETVTRAAQVCGFERGYTAVSRFVDPSETFLLSRMCIETTMTPRMLRTWMEGSYDLFDMVKTLCVR